MPATVGRDTDENGEGAPWSGACAAVRFERRYDGSPTEIWAALTVRAPVRRQPDRDLGRAHRVRPAAPVAGRLRAGWRAHLAGLAGHDLAAWDVRFAEFLPTYRAQFAALGSRVPASAAAACHGGTTLGR